MNENNPHWNLRSRYLNRFFAVLVVLKNSGNMAGQMKKKELNYFKALLTSWLDDLIGQADNTAIGLRDTNDRMADPLDRAVLDIDRNYTLRMRDRESILIKKIRKSLDDINDGTYGICEECGCEIAIARLKARPVAKRCFDCKTRQEEIEKLVGT